MNPGVRAPPPCPSGSCPSPPFPWKARTLEPGSLPSLCRLGRAPPEAGLRNLRGGPLSSAAPCGALRTQVYCFCCSAHLTRGGQLAGVRCLDPGFWVRQGGSPLSLRIADPGSGTMCTCHPKTGIPGVWVLGHPPGLCWRPSGLRTVVSGWVVEGVARTPDSGFWIWQQLV